MVVCVSLRILARYSNNKGKPCVLMYLDFRELRLLLPPAVINLLKLTKNYLICQILNHQ